MLGTYHILLSSEISNTIRVNINTEIMVGWYGGEHIICCCHYTEVMVGWCGVEHIIYGGDMG